ncbi:MAG TPA: hypothetical protein PLQ19_08860 [Aeromicrobium sp.]|nr:hypothetical protein [Aeromicrobium sp.]
MSDVFVYVISVLALVVGIFASWHTVKSYQFSNPLFYAIALLEVLLVVALVWGIIAVGSAPTDVQRGLYLSYLVTTVLIPPLAVFWGIGDKSRWGTGVVAVAMFTVSILMIRTHQIWLGHG